MPQTQEALRDKTPPEITMSEFVDSTPETDLPEDVKGWLASLGDGGPVTWWVYTSEQSTWAFVLTGSSFTAVEASGGDSRATTVPVHRISLIQETRRGAAVEVAIEVDGGPIVGGAEGVERYETKIGPFAEDGSQDAAGGAQQRINFEMNRNRYTLSDNTEAAPRLVEFAAAVRRAVGKTS